ncbi:MAG: hypothetical protein LBU65_06315 [Planctomycetaceae bacterium]|nr:hypothetical protein [Planctomycetaceae bacterium]
MPLQHWDNSDKIVVRADVGRIVRALQLFDVADKIDFTDSKYESYRWDARCKVGRKKALDHKWDWDAFHKFTEQGVERQTW